MFTGIIETVGELRSLNGCRLIVQADTAAWPDPIAVGESIANNGCCLTVVDFTPESLEFDLSEETVAKTTFGELRPGSKINLERAMRADGRFGGHIVQGHVDGTARIAEIRPTADATIFRFEFPSDKRGFLVEKGSVTLDGISLTVVDLKEDAFEVWVIPHTLSHTNLSDKSVGDRVNLEFDVIAKYVANLMNRDGNS